MAIRFTHTLFDDTDLQSGPIGDLTGPRRIEGGPNPTSPPATVPAPSSDPPSSPTAAADKAPSPLLISAASAGEAPASGDGFTTVGTILGPVIGAAISGLVINLNWDASVSSAPAAFKSDVQSAAAYLQSHFTDAVTINLNIGYGEVGGNAMAGLLGATQASFTSVSYSSLTEALASDATTASDASAVASLPASNPNGGNYWMTTAQAKALGLRAAANTSTDASIGFSSSTAFTYDNSGGVTAGSYDFMGVVLHEMTEAMGRMLLTGATLGATTNSFDALDLFHYSAAGTHDYAAATPGYFSTDAGATDLADFNTVAGDDAGDWASSVTGDAFDAIQAPGVINAISNADLTAVDVIGWDRVASNVIPAGVAMAPATGSLAALQASTGLTAGTALATIMQAGGTAQDTYSFALGGAGAASFTLTAGSGAATLATAASTVVGAAGGKLYALTLQATDTTSGASAQTAAAVVVGGSSADAESLSTLTSSLTASTPVLAYGLAGNDTLSGTGMTGRLWLDGGAGADTLTGGSGANFYLYGAASDSTAASMDTITNFNSATDFLDLTGLGVALTDVGLISASTTTIAGASIGWQDSGGNTFLYVNTGSKSSKLSSASMKIELQGAVTLRSSNVLTFGSNEDTAAPAAPTITAVTDDVAPITGTLIDGASTNDPNLTVSVALTGTGVRADDTVQLYDGPGTGTALGTAYTLTSADIAAGTATVQTGALIDGTTYAVTARLADQAQNQSLASDSFTVTEDTTSPVIAIDPISGDGQVDASEAATGFDVTGTTDAGDGQTVTVAIVDAGDAIVDSYSVAPVAGVWSAHVTSAEATALAQGNYAVKADVSDTAGNPAVEAVQDFSVVCYARGTHIAVPGLAVPGVAVPGLAVPGGEARVEDLRPGDRVMATSGSGEPGEHEVRWVGWRRLDLARHPAPETVDPVRIRRGAFAENLPHRDLLVSPAHGILADGRLICAIQLINGASIVRETSWTAVDYFHVELENHALLIAEGLAAESYLDTGNRGFFANGEQPLVLHPELIDETGRMARAASSCVPFACDADSVWPVWRRLADRAQSLGFPLTLQESTDDPGLRLESGGRVLRPTSVTDARHLFILAAGVEEVRLVSRAGAPSDAEPWRNDRRRLGVAVERMMRHGPDGVQQIALDRPDLAQGWWLPEQSADRLHRWTDGNAVVPLAKMDHPSMLEIIATNGGMTYLLEPQIRDRSQRAA